MNYETVEGVVEKVFKRLIGIVNIIHIVEIHTTISHIVVRIRMRTNTSEWYDVEFGEFIGGSNRGYRFQEAVLNTIKHKTDEAIIQFIRAILVR